VPHTRGLLPNGFINSQSENKNQKKKKKTLEIIHGIKRGRNIKTSFITSLFFLLFISNKSAGKFEK
jgi:hypothetical protein